MKRNLYFLTWTLLFLIFFVSTAPRLWVDLHREEIPTPSPTSSIDRQLEPLLQIAQPSARLSQMLAQLPADCSLIVVCPKDNDDWEFVPCAIGYLSWPRKLEKVNLWPNESLSYNVSGRARVLFCGLPAPIRPNADRTTLGPNLVLLSPVKTK